MVVGAPCQCLHRPVASGAKWAPLVGALLGPPRGGRTEFLGGRKCCLVLVVGWALLWGLPWGPSALSSLTVGLP